MTMSAPGRVGAFACADIRKQKDDVGNYLRFTD